MRKITKILAVVFIGLAWSVGGAKAQSDQELAAEISFWETVRDSDRPMELQAYLDAFPNGKFTALAILRLKALGNDPARVAPQSADADPQTIEANPTNIPVGQAFEYCLATTDQARRGPFASVVDPALALSLCEAASVSASIADQPQIRESKALIHLSAQDYEAALREATELVVDRPGRGQGLSCVAQTLLGRTDREGYCGGAAAAGDIFGIYGTLLRAAAEAPDRLPRLISDAIGAQPDGQARRDLERMIGLLLEDRLVSPGTLPDAVLARFQATSLEELLKGLGGGEQTLPIDLRIKAVLLARNGDDQDRADAAFLLENAAAQGDRKAMMALGQSALEEAGGIATIADDLREAVNVRSDTGASWLQRLVAVGPHQGAFYTLFSHFYGVGTQRDLAQASAHIGLIRGPDALEMRNTAEEIVTETVADPDAQANIVYVQLALARLGYDPGPSDGVLGARTESAFAEFAADRGIASQPLQVGKAVGLLLEREKWVAARTSNFELEGDFSGFLSNAPDPLAFGWDAAYAF